MNTSQKLPPEFYNRKVNSVAKALLGKIFVRKNQSQFLSGKIVEVEAYDWQHDEASHSFNGKTKRNEVMFGDAGHLYVYFTYGMHFCANVVTGKVGFGSAVLLRAIDPIAGIKTMAQNRFGKEIVDKKELINLCNGPAKICQAFGINRNSNGINLQADEIFIIDSSEIETSKIISTTRIGIKKSIDLPWRYYIKDNPFVSKK